MQFGAFEWAFRAKGAQPPARAFALTHYVGTRNKFYVYGGVKTEIPYDSIYICARAGAVVPAHAYKEKIEAGWITYWFYQTVPADSGMVSTCKPPAFVARPAPLQDATTKTQIQLLAAVATRFAIRDLVEEFIAATV